MKKYINIFALVTVSIMTSCEDFLQKEPLDFGNETIYLKSANDLKLYVNTRYVDFPTNTGFKGGIYNTDDNSDNQTNFWSNSNFYPGVKQVPQLNNSEWKFESIRSCNYFLDLVLPRKEKGEITGTEEDINHYIGEIYFFRAYNYFNLLTNYGDVPILEHVVSDKTEELIALSKRVPRNEVMRFIISDLEKATALMQNKASSIGRLHKDCARLMLARVALFEATWEKYHAGTCFVPGNSKWSGKKMYPDFTFKAGNAEAEINFFLDKAIAYSDSVVQTHKQLSNDYLSMFTSINIDTISEVLLAKSYVAGINGHCTSNALANGGKTGYTRSLVESFLMNNGYPIYTDTSLSGYKGDETIENVLHGRDSRLQLSMLNTPTPKITGRTAENTPTGYQVSKWWSHEDGQSGSATSGTTANPIFRAAEAYCIYLEAYYERHKALDDKCDFCWRSLRKRADMSEDYKRTIQYTNLSKERDLAAKTKGIDETLYNIRRERRCEFIAEGMRLLDLKRWRALDNMINYQIEGMNLWTEMYKRYNIKDLGADIVSQDTGEEDSKFIRVFKVTETDRAYNGYNFPKAHYLEPIPTSEFLLTTQDGNPDHSTIYQNPGWPNAIGGLPDYNFDYD